MDRVYVLLDITEYKHEEAVHILRTITGIRWVDVLIGRSVECHDSD